MIDKSEELLFPKLNKDIETDVLIIGGGISAAINAYIFNEKMIDVVIINRGKLSYKLDEYKINNIDNEINNTTKYIKDYNKLNYFIFTLGALYKLEAITDILKDKCNFVRRPRLELINKDEQIDSPFELPCHSGNLTYNYGTEIDIIKLEKELFTFCFDSKIPIFADTEVFELNFENETLEVITKNKQKIKCKKILFSSSYDSLLFFDKPLLSNNYPLVASQGIVTINNSAFNLIDTRSAVTNNDLIIEVGSNEVGYNFNVFITRPYICIHEEYPNVYFNINNDYVLNGLMGAMALSDFYLEKEECYLEIFNFN